MYVKFRAEKLRKEAYISKQTRNKQWKHNVQTPA